MIVNELVNKFNLNVLSQGDTFDCEIRGCFVGDLLSLAMSRIQEGNIWITVQTNVNILGVAALTEASCVIVANNMNIPENVIQKAVDEKICLLKSDLSAFELCCKIGEHI